MTAPTLTVIMSNYNHAHFLPGALQAILDQSFQPHEILITDDASTDNSVEILEQFAASHPIIHITRNERNMGPGFNAIRSFENSSSDYVYFAAADDRVLPGLFERSINLLQQYPAAGLCSAMSILIDEAGRMISRVPLANVSPRECFISPAQGLAMLRRSFEESWVLGDTCILRRDAVQAAGGFIQELGAFIDGFLYIVLALKQGVCYIPVPLSIKRKSSTGYGESAVSNLEVSKQMYTLAAHFMRTTYADIFPADFVDTWERRKLYHARLSAINRYHKNQISIIKSFFPNSKLVDRIICGGMWLLTRVQFYSLVLYLLARYRSDLWPILSNNLNALLRGIRVRMQGRFYRDPSSLRP